MERPHQIGDLRRESEASKILAEQLPWHSVEDLHEIDNERTKSVISLDMH